ncbi:MFS transporter [Candidimonas nitroreducens]|uniref:Major facilitator superfamily (MFS) profile domain-containing protein n=1 Tax=Candidimonas nitroreducens TaxID=683354 RepID=A0A225MQZ6_9BURK|nr:MFS transporter [Candidimonas nitroreducens]OWT61881.1 hypothetical protein CEY11_08615 [Candidimonas nitroreducens]
MPGLSLTAWLRLLPLILVILIDSIGYTVIIPVMSTMLLGDAPAMMMGADASTRYIVYGVAVGIYELMMLYMAPVMGELSDRVGRRRILLVCMAGVGAGFVLIGVAIWLNLVLLLLLGRLLGGATAGSQAVAQAAAVDRSTPQDKSLVLNICLLASSVGFILGPLIGGMMSYDERVDLNDFTTPVFLMAALAGIGLLLLVFGFRETPPARVAHGRIDWWMGVRGFKAAWADGAIRRLVAVFGLMQLGWGSYFLFFPSLLINRFGQDAGTISLLMGLQGVGFCLAYGVFLPVLQRRLESRVLAVAGLWFTAALVAVSAAAYHMALQWALTLPVSIAVSVAYGAIITLFSNAVGQERQGWILGISISVNAAMWGLASIVSGALSGLGYGLPILLALLSLAASAVLMGRPAPGAGIEAPSSHAGSPGR